MNSKDEGEMQKKGGSLESLSHVELVTKCRNLLSIAQRAKKARDDALEENSRYKQEVENFNSKESDSKIQIDKLTESITSLTDEKNKLTKQIDDIHFSNENLKENLQKVKQQLLTLRERDTELEKDNENQKEQLNLLAAKLKKETAIREQLETDKNSLNDDLEKLTENTEQMKIICKEIAQERACLENEFAKANTELSSLNEEKSEWIAYLSAKFPEEEFSTARSWIEFFNRYIQHINDENNKMIEDSLQRNSEENVVYNNEIEKLNLLIKELNNEKELLNNEIIELETKNSRLSENLGELNVSRNTLLKKLDEVRIETQALIENSEILSEENSLLKTDKNKLEEELNCLINEKIKINDECEKLKFENKDLIIENETLNNKLIDLQSDIDKINIDFELLSSEKNSLTKNFNDLSLNYTKLVEENLELQQKYDEFSKNNLKLNESIFELEKLNSEYDHKIGDINTNVEILEELKQENERLKSNSVELKSCLKELSVEKEIWFEKEKERISELVSMKKELVGVVEFIISRSTEYEDPNKIIEHVEDENCDLSVVLKSLKNSLNRLVEEKNLYKNRVNEFNDNIENINLKILENEKIIENLKIEKQQVKDLLEEKVSENNNMIKSLESLKMELENISHHMKVSEKEKNEENVKDFENVQSINNELNNKLNILKAEKEKISNDLQGIIKENFDLLTDKQKLINESESHSKTIEDLKKKILEMEENSNSLLKNLNLDKSKASDDLQKIKLENENLMSVNQKLMNQNEILLKDIEKLNEKFLDMERNLQKCDESNNVLQKRCAELENINEMFLKDIKININSHLKSLSVKDQIFENSKDEQEFLNGLKKLLELIDCEFNKKEAENKYLEKVINEKEEDIYVIKKENNEILRELDIFKNNLGLVDKVFLRSDALVDEKEDCLKRIIDHNSILAELCVNYSSCFNVDNVEAVEYVKEKLNQLKNNQWVLNNNECNRESMKLLEQDQSWEVIQNKDRMKMEESSEDINSEMKTLSDDIIMKKDKEISELQDKIKELKTVALKLKKRISDLNQQLENERQKYEADKNKLMNLTAAAKNAQTLQQECDRLADELEENKKKIKSIRKSCDTLEESETKLRFRVSNLESELEIKDKEIISLKDQLEISQTSLHNVQKELEERQKEKTAQDVIVKELEKELLTLQENLKTTKSSLEQAKQESRKQSVLSLEMQDYEKSVKDLTSQISQEKELVKQLEEELDAKNSIQRSLQEQIELLEKRIVSEEERANVFNDQLTQTRKNLENAEKISLQRAKEMSQVTRQLEMEKSNKDILALQLSDLTAENQKQIESTRLQNEALLNRVAKLESDLRCSEMKCKRVEEEMTRINKEFEAYKIRAQSVLRQRGGSAAEREAKEECIRLQEIHNSTKSKLDLTMSELERVKSELSLVVTEKETLEKKCDNLNNILLQRNKELDRQINEHRSHKISTDTLIQCYKSQLEEKDRGYQMELDSLREQLSKVLSRCETVFNSNNEMDTSMKDSSVMEMEINRTELNENTNALPPRPPLIEREDGEGSEGNESSGYSMDNSRPGLISLEKLLNSPALSEDGKDLFSSEKIDNLRSEMAASNTRVRHLTALLNESEKDSARKEEQISVLKEEIRRLQRCIERQPHAHNTEYLKNVVFKFVTLHGGDERSRLVPVLDTILKLSPDEHKQLAAVAKGETDQSSSWGLYLPSWPSLQS